MTQATIDALRHRVQLLRIMLQDFDKLPAAVQKRRTITVFEMMDSMDAVLLREIEIKKPINAHVKELEKQQ